MCHDVGREWRCSRCGRLLGVVYHRLIHLKFAGGHEYLVTRPASARCPRCAATTALPDIDDAPTGR